MSAAIDGLLFSWKKNMEYGPLLVSDLSEEQMVQQPVTSGTPSNHPAWVFSHLNVYLPLIEKLIQGETFDDPKDHRFGRGSRPENDRSIYASKSQLVDDYVKGHQRVIDLLAGADDDLLTREVTLPRWKEVMPNLAVILPYLMILHEATHLGQLSAWRRIQGMPSVQ